MASLWEFVLLSLCLSGLGVFPRRCCFSLSCVMPVFRLCSSSPLPMFVYRFGISAVAFVVLSVVALVCYCSLLIVVDRCCIAYCCWCYIKRQSRSVDCLLCLLNVGRCCCLFNMLLHISVVMCSCLCEFRFLLVLLGFSVVFWGRSVFLVFGFTCNFRRVAWMLWGVCCLPLKTWVGACIVARVVWRCWW